MLTSFALRKIDSQEKKLGASLDYLRHIAKVSFRLLMRFSKILSFANCRKKLPADAAHVAALVASQQEDCGSCLQINVNLARQDGTSREIIEAVLEHRSHDLPEELTEVLHFTQAVVAGTGEEESLRELIRHRWGEEALIELAMIIAAARMFPTVKRALGYATSCSRVEVRV